jgi:predicted transcriptional regulator
MWEETSSASKKAWRGKELRKAIEEAEKGMFVSHEAMLAWVESLGTKNELPPPEPDIYISPRKDAV